MTPFDRFCEACGALAGGMCFPGCCGYAAMLDDLAARVDAVEVECADVIVARALTVEASRLYARLAHPAGKGRPGATT